MSEEAKLNIGCIAVGSHAERNILPAINSSSKFNLFGIHRRDKIKGKKISEEYNCKFYETVDDLLLEDNINAVYISSPTALHDIEIKKAISAGKNVLVEKSSFYNHHQCLKVCENAISANLVIMEAFMYRFHNQFKELRKIIDQKIYGQILNFKSIFGFPHLDHSNFRYSDELGGGALLDAGAYAISSALEIIGSEPIIRYSSIGNSKKYKVDTYGVAILESGNQEENFFGFCNWYFGGPYTNEILITFSEAQVCFKRVFSKPENHSSKIEVYKNDALLESIIIEPHNHFLSMLDYFYKTINEDKYEFEISKTIMQSKLLNDIKLNK